LLIFNETAADYFNDFTITGTGYAEHVDVVNASASLFSILDFPIRVSRAFTPEEDAEGSRVVVLSESM
jgi:hypothetical protein